jgi:hypothetical protein
MINKTHVAAAALMAQMGVGGAQAQPIDVGALAKLATIDPRYQSYNVEMVDVTGGQFWAPYGSPKDQVYAHQPPLDLSNPRLIALARGLGPTYMRVSGTWANNTYLEGPGERLSKPPAGFAQVLTRDQWKGVIAFAKAADAKLVTSFAVSNGVRGPDGVWTSEQAQRRLDLTRELGGSIEAAELFNEPNIPFAGADIPKNYSAENFGADFRVFRAWAKANVPEMKVLGPGWIGMGTTTKPTFPGLIDPDALMKAVQDNVDVVSYHFYGGFSPRCAALKFGQANQADALTWNWLDLTVAQYNIMAAQRDQYQPGRALMITETAQAACGGSPWASTFLDSFRYLNQLGVLAQKGVQAVMHDTLTSSDYALIDGETLTPRPNYWAAVLWRRTMGRTVLASPASPSPSLRIYAHCLPEGQGGVGILALNVGKTAESVNLGGGGRAWTLTGQPVDTKTVLVNGKAPGVDASHRLTGLEGVPVAGNVTIPAESITFAAFPAANNPACR